MSGLGGGFIQEKKNAYRYRRYSKKYNTVHWQSRAAGGSEHFVISSPLPPPGCASFTGFLGDNNTNVEMVDTLRESPLFLAR